ncbi:hypothetical protein DPMN_185889 [Dreissena polymorpha]|uniref:Uncharacterized protein n=1 Tax=Dreissena polymorpha TaxID=45954 RepID=A0A9D4DMB5_DREPO|nr:hypothetical protein DPMN_185889 [Dreissena polymorpha]
MEVEKRSSNHSLYQYTIEMNEELDTSLKNMTSDQVERMVAQENMKNLALSLKKQIRVWSHWVQICP